MDHADKCRVAMSRTFLLVVLQVCILATPTETWTSLTDNIKISPISRSGLLFVYSVCLLWKTQATSQYLSKLGSSPDKTFHCINQSLYYSGQRNAVFRSCQESQFLLLFFGLLSFCFSWVFLLQEYFQSLRHLTKEHRYVLYPRSSLHMIRVFSHPILVHFSLQVQKNTFQL